jgi:hypothetical protein
MTRFLALTVFSGSFLALSPELREQLRDALSDQVALLHRYSPYSWLVLGTCGLVMLFFYMRRCSAPR